MEGSTPGKKRTFGFRLSSGEKKSSGSRKKSRELFAAADASKDLGAENLCETPKAPQDTELNQELQHAGKDSGKKWKKKHRRHFSFGGKFHKHKGKYAAPETADPRDISSTITSTSSECFETETVQSNANQSPSNTLDANDVKIEASEKERQEDDDEAVEATRESDDSAAVCSTMENVTEECNFETATSQIAAISDPEPKEDKPEEEIQSSREDEEVAKEGDAESSDLTPNPAVPLAEEEDIEVEDVTWVPLKKSTISRKEQNKDRVIPDQSSQSEGVVIGGHAKESEFQMTKEEQAIEIPSSPKETTTEKQGDEEESEFPTAAKDKSISPSEGDTSPKSPEVQESSKKQPEATKEKASNLGIGAIYQALLHVKESLINGEKQSSINMISGIPYEICHLTVDTGRTKLSDLFVFLLGQAGYSTRHMLGYFVKILIQKYPHCFQVKELRKRKRSKEHRNDGTNSADTVC